jgi:hypothetical protein
MKARIYFESMGRRAESKGEPLKSPRHWPKFARQAFARGWILNRPVTGGRSWEMTDDNGNRLSFVNCKIAGKGGAK